MIAEVNNPSLQLANSTEGTNNQSRLILFFLFIFFLVTPARGQETIDIAAIYSITGAAAADNAPSVEGVRYATEDINQKGGIFGKRINLMIFDNLSTPIGAFAAAEKAAQANVTAIVGPAWSSHAISAAKSAQASGIPMISDFATNPEVTKIGDYIFRVCFTDVYQGSVLVRFARQDLKASSAVIFTDIISDYSIGLSEIFKKNFVQLGGEILLELEYKYKDRQFDQHIKKAKRAGSDIIFLSGHDESGLIAKMLQRADIPSVFIGGDGWETESFWTKGGRTLKQGYYCSHWSEHSNSDNSRLFVEKYQHTDNFGVATALGYDAVMVLADAIRRTGSTDRAKIRDALANTRFYKGITGTITFNQYGDPVKSAVIMEIINGAPRYLKTLEP